MANEGEEEIRRCEERWISVYLAGDAEGFAALLDEEFVYTSERGVFRKPEYVQNLASGVIEMRGLENTELTVVLHGDTAVSFGTVTMRASLRGQDISGRDRFTRVWVRKGGVWRAVALHANNLSPEP